MPTSHKYVSVKVYSLCLFMLYNSFYKLSYCPTVSTNCPISISNMYYFRKKENELIKKLVQLVEDRDNLINMEERERLTAIEMDMQFKKVISTSKF